MARASKPIFFALFLIGMGLPRGSAWAQNSTPGDAAATARASKACASLQDAERTKCEQDLASKQPGSAAAKPASGAAPAVPPQPDQSALPAASAPSPDKPAADQFAFPEAISRKAAAAAAPAPANSGNQSLPSSPDPASGPASPAHPFPMPSGGNSSTPERGGLHRREGAPPAPGESDSSSSSSSSGSAAPDAVKLQDAGSSEQMFDSYRSEKDDDVADFYNKNGNYMGAYLRYQDAVHFNPEDEPGQYGLAEMARKLGHLDEAMEHYRAYLKIAPHGDKAKDAERALKQMDPAGVAK